MADKIPRRAVELDPVRQIMGMIQELRAEVGRLQKSANLANGSISDGALTVQETGQIEWVRAEGDTAIVIDKDSFEAYDPSGQAVARFGELLSRPGQYGGEVFIDGVWVPMLTATSGTIEWASISDKPSWAASTTSVPGSAISGAVASATSSATATEASHAALADGSQYGWTNPVAGTEFYALWVGNDGGYHLGRNVSSIKYKTNVRTATEDPKRALQARPVHYDRKPTEEVLGPGVLGPRRQYPGKTGEFGLIAEEVFEWAPEIVTWYKGAIDSVRYELLGVVLLPLVQEHDREIQELRNTITNQQKQIDALVRAVQALGGSVDVV